MAAPLASIDAKSLAAFGKAMRAAPKEVRQAFAKSVGHEAKVIPPEIRASAIESLPAGGGLNVWVSKLGMRVRQSWSGRSPGITITGTLDNKRAVRKTSSGGRYKARRSGTFGKVADVRAINRGRVMHPAWGRSKADGSGLFGPQMVRPGFWTRPLEGLVARRAAKRIKEAIDQAAKTIARRAA